MKPSIIKNNLDSYSNNDNSNNSDVEVPYNNINSSSNTYKQIYSDVKSTKTILTTVTVIEVSVAAIMLTLLII